MSTSSTSMHFEVAPSVLFKLGQDLITDDAQALVELIKNSYDADAKTVRVNIDTEGWYDRATGERLDPGGSSAAGAVQGRLTVTDDGSGMDLTEIQRGWLTVSNSLKRALKESGGMTAAGRTPLGDKGLGRLGVQRLGAIVQLRTVSHKGDVPRRNVLTIEWGDFNHAEMLTGVDLVVQSTDTDEAPGTEINILGLANPTYWEGRGELALQKQLASILSPYDSANGLRVFIVINGADIDMRREARRILDTAPFILRFDYEADQLTMSAGIQVSVLRGRNPQDRSSYQRLASSDNGYNFGEWLLSSSPRGAKNVGAVAGDDKHFLRFSRVISLQEAAPAGTAEDPGSFSGEISTFSYETDDESAIDSTSELRSFARTIAGVRVYRDGFGIRLDDDWLGLSKQQTTARSFYGLRPLNTAGYVNLTARGNAALEETSSREAFKDTPAWRGFNDLMVEVVKFARDTQTFVRRGWNSYVRQHELPSELDESASPREISRHIVERSKQAMSAKAELAQARGTLRKLAEVTDDLGTSRDESENTVWQDPVLAEALLRATNQIQAAEEQLAAALTKVESVLGELDEIAGATALLEEKVTTTEDRIAEAWESVALGLTAEVLAHEVDQISDRLRGRSHQILDYLRGQPTVDERSVGYAEHVRASSAELARQVARLNPALRFRRETKSDHHVSDLAESAIAFHSPRLDARQIDLRLNVVRDFSVHMNEGKFMQVIDNLIRNSEYWVGRQIAAGMISRGEIVISIDSPRVEISDNGPGVSPAIEDSLFEPFVTAKPGKDGRGLGLYVVSRLLDSENATVTVGTHRNVDGRRDTFEIDLRGALPSSSDERK